MKDALDNTLCPSRLYSKSIKNGACDRNVVNMTEVVRWKFLSLLPLNMFHLILICDEWLNIRTDGGETHCVV